MKHSKTHDKYKHVISYSYIPVRVQYSGYSLSLRRSRGRGNNQDIVRAFPGYNWLLFQQQQSKSTIPRQKRQFPGQRSKSDSAIAHNF